MSYRQNPFAGNAKSNRYLPEDDIDTLFAQLHQIEPPPLLIAQILAQVSQNVSAIPMVSQPLRQHELETWTTYAWQKNLC